VLDVHSLLLLAVPGQLMVLAGAVLTYLTGFGRVSILLGAVAIVSLAALGSILRPVRGALGLVLVAVAVNVLAFAAAAWQALVHLPATLGVPATALVVVLALVAFGPTVVALAASARSAR
jgi:hypothetical protein